MSPVRRLAILALSAGLGLALPASAQEAPPRTVEGRILIVRPDGSLPAQSDGFAMLRLRSGPSQPARDERVPIRQGSWTLEAATGDQLQVRAIRLDEGDGYPVDAARWQTVPPDGTMDLGVRLLRSFELQVYGPDGRTQLQDVVVVRRRRRDARLPHPGPPSSKTEVVTDPSPSPVDIRVTEPELYTYFAKAPGHAWGRIDVDPFLGGVATLLLEPGGDLRVELVQQGPERGRVFRVRREGAATREVHLELKRYGSTVVVDALPVGAYRVSNEEPVRPENMPVYGSLDVQVRAGETSHYRLRLDRHPTSQPVPAAGRLHLPAAWGDPAGVTLVLRRIDRYGATGRWYEVPGSELEPVPGEPDQWTWSLEEVQPGAYDLQLAPLGVHAFREVQGGGHLRLDLAIPEPRELPVHLLDGSTHEFAPVQRVLAYGPVPEVAHSKLPDLPAIEPAPVAGTLLDTGRFLLRTPRHDLTLAVDHPDYLPATLAVSAAQDVLPPWILTRTTALRLRVLRGGRAVKLAAEPTLEPLAPGPRLLGTRQVGEALQLDVSAPGTFELRLPPEPGRTLPTPRRVTLTAGEVLTLDIDLGS